MYKRVREENEIVHREGESERASERKREREREREMNAFSPVFLAESLPLNYHTTVGL